MPWRVNGAAKQRLDSPVVADANASVSFRVPRRLRAGLAQQAERGRERRLDALRRRPLQFREQTDLRRVSQAAERGDRVILQRPVELGDAGDVGDRKTAVVLAKRFDDPATEIVRALQHQRREHRSARADP